MRSRYLLVVPCLALLLAACSQFVVSSHSDPQTDFAALHTFAWLPRDQGFALSVLGTAGLLVLARRLAQRLSAWLPRGLALALAVPLAAQLACQPVLILLNPALPLFGVPANLVAEPAAPVATVLGCLACLVLPWAPALGQVVVWLAWLPSAWIAAVARFAAGLPGAALPWPEVVLHAVD